MGEFIIVPLAAGVGDTEDAIYALNQSGRVIWNRLDGRCSLKDVIAELSAEFDASEDEIEADVLGLAEELVRRKMIVAADDD